MTHKTVLLATALACSAFLPACAPQNVPSMMNPNKPQLVGETSLRQMPVKDVSDGYLRHLADDYARFGSNGLQLTLAYDPSSRTYTALQSFRDLERFKSGLEKYGVRGIRAESVASNDTDPVLLVTFDMLKAQAPEGCGLLPGLETNQTTRHVGEYKFGCSIETMLARQVYRPADLAGNDQLDVGDGRRAANSTEYYRVVSEEEATGDLNVLGRSQIQQ